MSYTAVMSDLILAARVPQFIVLYQVNLASLLLDSYVIGVAIHYMSIQVFIFWLSHVSFIYYGVVFPLHAKKTKGTLQRRLIEITTVVIGKDILNNFMRYYSFVLI